MNSVRLIFCLSRPVRTNGNGFRASEIKF